MSTKRAFLSAKHPCYDEQKALWEKNERRMRGGIEVVDELVPFDWEILGGDHYKHRQDQAVYLNFPDRFASIMAGHLMRNSPIAGAALNFGTLGEVRRRRDIDEPTRAELLYYNTDGRGSDGSEWRSYWMHVIKGAIATGHRWVLCEGPPRAPRNRGSERGGLRPFVSDYSPVAVHNWHYEDGRLVMAVIKRRVRRLRLDQQGQLQGNAGEDQTLLLTADGFTGFGPEFRNGGWYTFDSNHEMTGFGFYEDTDGQIPMVALYYERQRPTVGTNAISRSGVTEMGNAAVAYMNLSSAADFDAWDGATSCAAVLGADEDGFNLFVTKRNEGNRYAPLPIHKDGQHVPEIQDTSTGIVVADVFEKGLKRKRQEAEELMLNELEAAPYASGASKEASFADAKEPRLAVMAAEVGTAQNAVIHFLEQLWAGRPINTQGAVEWPERFSLEQPVEEIKKFFEALQFAELRSATAEKKAIMVMARKLGISGDDEDRAVIEEEIEASAKIREEADRAEIERTLRPTGAAV